MIDRSMPSFLKVLHSANLLVNLANLALGFFLNHIKHILALGPLHWYSLPTDLRRLKSSVDESMGSVTGRYWFISWLCCPLFATA